MSARLGISKLVHLTLTSLRLQGSLLQHYHAHTTLHYITLRYTSREFIP